MHLFSESGCVSSRSPLFFSLRFVPSLHGKSHGNKTESIFAEQFVGNAETKITAVPIKAQLLSIAKAKQRCSEQVNACIHCKAIHAHIYCV